MSQAAPRKLSTVKGSPTYDGPMLEKIDKVFVDGVHIPRCVAYDMDAGWAKGMTEHRTWGPKVYGTVKVTMKGG